jgi:hypothetical protein
MKVFLAFAIALLGLFSGGSAWAHGMRTAYVEIIEHSRGNALVRFRSTVVGSAKLEFPPECQASLAGESDKGKAQGTANPLVQGGETFVLQCPGSLEGRTIGVRGLGEEISEAVVWIEPWGGEVSTFLMTPAKPSLEIPKRITAGQTLAQYIPLGIEHILTGPDHLLFLLLLVLVLRRPSSVLLAETAFTISHGLSFSAAALGLVHVSKEATEACIALSLLYLALDVERRDRPAPTAKAMAILALGFGLVHGLGFAGGMTELGLPKQYVGFALLGFGLGVEVGQVAFLLVALGLVYLLRRSRFSFQGTLALTYLSGGLAAYWFLLRVRDCFPG